MYRSIIQKRRLKSVMETGSTSQRSTLVASSEKRSRFWAEITLVVNSLILTHCTYLPANISSQSVENQGEIVLTESCTYPRHTVISARSWRSYSHGESRSKLAVNPARLSSFLASSRMKRKISSSSSCRNSQLLELPEPREHPGKRASSPRGVSLVGLGIGDTPVVTKRP
jgi:hypothetical protein